MTLKRNLATAALVAATVTALQGCFAVVATGVTAGALMAADRRSSGAYVEDESIEMKALGEISKRYGDKAHVNVTSYNRKVLLTGEAPDDAAKSAIERLTADLPNVQAVTNDIQTGAPTDLGSRSSDSYITSKVKGRFVEANKFHANNVKVVTEAGTVYLLGLVTRVEADAATEIARTTSDVRKVVRVFEYVSDEQARQLDNRPPEAAKPAGSKS